jgi:hypothetical protein
MVRLSKQEIREIIAAFYGGESVPDIARRTRRDRKTISYHIEKYDEAYGGTGGYIAMVKVEIQHECIHPSMKCLCCGKAQDIIFREDRARILALETEIRRLHGSGESGTV